MRTERRCVQRKRPGGISYFEFEAGSGGIVLDASEKGLGFQAADAVHQLGRSRIWVSPRPEERIELTADVIWTDGTGKTGGLRFIETGVDSSKKLRNWLGSQEESEASRGSEAFPLPAWATQALGDLRHESRPDTNLLSSTVVPPARSQVEERRAELHSIPGLPSLFTSTSPWRPQDSEASGGRVAYRIATGFLIVVLAVAGVIFFDLFRPKVGESLIHLGEKISGSANMQPQNSAPPSTAQTPPQASLAGKATPDAVQDEAKPDVVQKEAGGAAGMPLDSSREVNSQTPNPPISGITPATKEAANRLPNREATNSRQDRSAEATRLWSAVASGDSSAEVELALLYLRGEGVPRNCVQAKVLLRAAAKGGNFAARQQLKKLRASGCR